ncbi:ECF-type sigma factor [Alteromonas sp. S015]|uniref:ECF-type sigma factor n=1 Tax=Alteromonas sp. S015 TaxID=3117401 RepID=UPI002FE0D250
MTEELTEIIQKWHQGDNLAQDSLFHFAYMQLRVLAKRERIKVSNKYTDNNLLLGEEVYNTTSIIHEAYLKLEKSDVSYIRNRREFYSMTAKVMRQVMFEKARKIGAKKRLPPEEYPEHGDGGDMMSNNALDQALEQFSNRYPRQSEILQLKYFMGFDNKKISEILQYSQSLVEKDAKFAKSWMKINLN